MDKSRVVGLPFTLYERLLSIPPLISPPWSFVNLLPRVILSCAVHRDNFLILPVPRQSSDSFVSIVREIVYRTLKQTGSGRVGFETRLGMNVWSAAEGESRAFSRRFSV